MDFESLRRMLEELRDEFVHEKNQGLLQHDLHKAESALAGEYAVDRIERRIYAKLGVNIAQPRAVRRMR